MVEIIYRGTPPGERSIEAKCGVCRTEFRFEAKEGTPYNDRDGSGFQIACPVCSRQVWRNLR